MKILTFIIAVTFVGGCGSVECPPKTEKGFKTVDYYSDTVSDINPQRPVDLPVLDAARGSGVSVKVLPESQLVIVSYFENEIEVIQYYSFVTVYND